MQENEYPFESGIRFGLRKTGVNPRDMQALSTALNFKCSDGGIDFVPAKTPFTSNFTLDWPFPQLLVLQKLILLCERTRISEWDSNLGVFVPKITDLAVDDVWDYADYGDYVVLCSSGIIIERAIEGMYTSYTGSRMPNARTICDFKGQMIAGNIPGWYDASTSFVTWGRIGTIDFDLGQTDLSATSRGAISQQAGYGPLRGGGVLLKVARLGDVIMLYGSNTVEMLTPVKSPVATFGFKEIFPFGILDKGAVGGTKDEHLIISSDGTLYKVSTQGTEKLGYKEFFANFAGEKIQITYNGVANEYYISNGLRTFIYSKGGLTETGQTITSGGVDNGVFECICHGVVDTNLMVTDRISFKQRSMKTIYAIEISAETAEQLEVAVDWRNAVTNVWRRTPFRRTGPHGVVTIPCSGVDFRIVVRQTNPVACLIDRIVVRWKLTDMRSVRGLFDGGVK